MKKGNLIIAAVVVVAMGILFYVAGCCSKKTPAKIAPAKPVPVVPVAGYEVGIDQTIVAQAVEPGSVMADVYVAGHMKPRRERVRIAPGCWLVPKPVVTMPGNPAGPGVVCDEDADMCEVEQ